jgi:EAL domain-containing protein (putative c-di-GMP-specific phosphodiesterase class I)
VDVLKIDRTFMAGVVQDERDAAIVRTIIAMARNLGLDVVAEGVETEAQLEFLGRVGCGKAQGYLLGRPAEADAFAAWIAAGACAATGSGAA